jgi:hypothetical protein
MLRDVAHDERNGVVWDAALGGGHKAKVCWQIDNRKWKEALYRALMLIRLLEHRWRAAGIRPDRHAPEIYLVAQQLFRET